MQGSSDSNDVLPQAVVYFYPNDEQKKKEKLLDCGEIVGMVQYFQHDLFRSIARTLYFQGLFVVHQHFGRHSSILCLPDDQYSAEEAHVYLTHILNLFNMLYGTWNHIQETYEIDDTLPDFLNQALTPIVNYVLNKHRSLTNLFSTIEYTPLKRGNQRVLLDSKHLLANLKSKFGLRDGYIGYDEKVLYSTADPDITYLLQILFQTKTDITDSLISIPWDSDFQLRNGVSLYRVFLRRSPIPNVPETVPSKNNTSSTTTNSNTTVVTNGIPIFHVTSEDGVTSDGSPITSPRFNPNQLSVPLSFSDPRRHGRLFPSDHSGSSEETGFDTDTGDERPPRSAADPMSSSSLSLGDTSNDIPTEDSEDEPDVPTMSTIDIAQLQEANRSRSSTGSDDHIFNQTIRVEGRLSIDDSPARLHFVHVDSFDTSEDEESFHVAYRGSTHHTRERSQTVTSDEDADETEYIHNEVQVSWTNIPDKNTEVERDQFILYVQRHSKMIFIGIVERSLLNDDYLNKLWTLMLARMAKMDTDIQVVPMKNDIIKSATDVRFEFNEQTRMAEFKRIFDGLRYHRRIPSEESTYMAFFARTELDRYTDRKVIGLSQGSYFISLDRRLPDRIVYLCQRYQETL